MPIFVSSQAVDREPAVSLIERLRANGCALLHSPSNPLDGEDARWDSWYNSGLQDAVAQCDVFVIVVDAGWDSSTWMAAEADRAMHSGTAMHYWNPLGIHVRAKGMQPYLVQELPADLEEAASILAASTAA